MGADSITFECGVVARLAFKRITKRLAALRLLHAAGGIYVFVDRVTDLGASGVCARCDALAMVVPIVWLLCQHVYGGFVVLALGGELTA